MPPKTDVEIIDVDASDLSTLSDAPSEPGRNGSSSRANGKAGPSSARAKSSARTTTSATNASKRKATVDLSGKPVMKKPATGKTATSKATTSKAAAAKATASKATSTSKATGSRRKDDGEIKKVIRKRSSDSETVTAWKDLYSRPPGNEAEPEGELRDDWQVAYVWAYLTRFEYVGIGKTRVDGIWKIDEFEAALASNGVELAMQEILVALLRDLNAVSAERAARSREDAQRRKIWQSGKVPPKRKTDSLSLPELPAIEHDLKALIDSRLTNPRRNVFDPYFFETRITHDKESKQGKAELESPKRSKMQQILRQEAEEEFDRRVRNPLATKPFAESGWQVRIKILRQLVDWILEENLDIRQQIADGYADRARVERRLEDEAQEAKDGLVYQDLDKLLSAELEPPSDGPTNAFQVLGKGKAKASEPPAERSAYEEMAVRMIDRDSNNKRVFRIDPDYRLYSLGNHYHITAEWRVIADSKETYEQKMREYWQAGKDVKRLRAEVKKAPAKGKKALQSELSAAERDYTIARALFDGRQEVIEREQAIEKDKARQERARQRREQDAWRQHQVIEHVYETRATRRKRVDYTEREDTFDDDYEESPAPSRAERRSGARSRDSTGSRPTVDDDDDVNDFARPATRGRHAIVDSGDDDAPEDDEGVEDEDQDEDEDDASIASPGGSEFAASDHAEEEDDDDDDNIEMDD